MITRFHRGARREFAEAVSFYETRVPGLGMAFAAEVRYAALPYAVIDATIIILAVAHTRRQPGYWRRRLDD